MGVILTRGTIDPIFSAPMGTDYLQTTTKVVWRNLDGATLWGPVECLNNFAAVTNPGITDDSAAGYAVGSIWLNVTLDIAFKCLDSSVGAAVWIQSSDSIRTVTTTPETLNVGDTSLVVDATAGNAVVNLPAAAGVKNKVFRVKKKDSTGNTVTIDPNGAELIDGISTFVLTATNQSTSFQSDGTEWWIF